MTDAQRCEPPESLRGVDGWHWVEGPYSTGPLNWRHFNGGFWELSGDQPDWTPERAHDVGCRYHSPAASPDLVRALVEALEGLMQAPPYTVTYPAAALVGTYSTGEREAALATARAALHRAKEAGV
jgi:hypothetical protein